MATIKFKNANGVYEEINAGKLERPVTINGVSFDGSSNITIPVGGSVPDVDGTTIEVANSKLQVKDAGITDTKIGNRTLSTATSTDTENISASTLSVLLQNLSNRIKSLLDRFNVTTGHKHNGTDSAVISYSNLSDKPSTAGSTLTEVANPSPLSSVDISTVNKLANHVDFISKKYIEDLSSTTKTVSIVDNLDVRLGTLSSITVTASVSRFVCSISFSSGTTATLINFPSGIKWYGIDCGSGSFLPRTSKRYNIVLWDDGINTNAIVNAA